MPTGHIPKVIKNQILGGTNRIKITQICVFGVFPYFIIQNAYITVYFQKHRRLLTSYQFHTPNHGFSDTPCYPADN